MKTVSDVNLIIDDIGVLKMDVARVTKDLETYVSDSLEDRLGGMVEHSDIMHHTTFRKWTPSVVVSSVNGFAFKENGDTVDMNAFVNPDSRLTGFRVVPNVETVLKHISDIQQETGVTMRLAYFEQKTIPSFYIITEKGKSNIYVNSICHTFECCDQSEDECDGE